MAEMVDTEKAWVSDHFRRLTPDNNVTSYAEQVAQVVQEQARARPAYPATEVWFGDRYQSHFLAIIRPILYFGISVHDTDELAQRVSREDKALRIREHLRAYREHPETAQEVTATRVTAKRLIAAVPWDEE